MEELTALTIANQELQEKVAALEAQLVSAARPADPSSIDIMAKVAALEKQIAGFTPSYPSSSASPSHTTAKHTPSPNWFTTIPALVRFNKYDYDAWVTSLQDGFAASSTTQPEVMASIAITRTRDVVRKYIKSLEQNTQENFDLLKGSLQIFCYPDPTLEQGNILDELKVLGQGSKTARDYVSAVIDLKIRAKEAKVDLGDRAWAHALLSGLKDRTAARIITNSQDLSNFSLVLSAILKTDLITDNQNPKSNQPEVINALLSNVLAALKAIEKRQQQGPRNPQGGREGGPPGKIDRKNATCPECGKKGHTSAKYFKCGKYQPNGQPTQPTTLQQPQNPSRTFSPHQGGVCFNCGKPGHFANKCRFPKQYRGTHGLLDNGIPSIQALQDLFTF